MRVGTSHKNPTRRWRYKNKTIVLFLMDSSISHTGRLTLQRLFPGKEQGAQTLCPLLLCPEIPVRTYFFCYRTKRDGTHSVPSLFAKLDQWPSRLRKMARFSMVRRMSAELRKRDSEKGIARRLMLKIPQIPSS